MSIQQILGGLVALVVLGVFAAFILWVEGRVHTLEQLQPLEEPDAEPTTDEIARPDWAPPLTKGDRRRYYGAHRE